MRKKVPGNCTYCGQFFEDTTEDHVFEQSANSGAVHIKVLSCNKCNSEELNDDQLASFLSLNDYDLAQVRVEAFDRHPGRFKQWFERLWKPLGGDRYVVFPDQKLTNVFKKWFLGIRRHVMGEGWYFIPLSQVCVYTVQQVDGKWATIDQPDRKRIDLIPEPLLDRALNPPFKKCGKFFYEIDIGDEVIDIGSIKYVPPKKVVKDEFRWMGVIFHEKLT